MSSETGTSEGGLTTPVSVTRAALRTPAFHWLTAGWVLTNVADSLLMLLLAVWVKDLTGSNAAAGITFALFGVPALAAPLLGHVADRVSRRRMLIVSYAIGAVTLLPLFAVRDAGQVWLIYLVTVVYSAMGYATAAAQSGILRDLLPDDALGPANGRFTMIDQALRVIMPVLGAAIYAATGMVPLIVTAMAGFAGAAGALAMLRLVETPPTPADQQQGMITELAAGFRHLARTRPLGVQSITLTVVFGALGLVNAIVFAILDAFGIPAAMLGPVMVAQGLAGAVGGALAPRIMRRIGRPQTIVLGVVAVVLGHLPLAGSILWLAIVGVGLLGFGITVAIVAFVTERQVRTPATLQGRVSSATNVLFNLPSVVFTAIGAGLLGVVDYRVLVIGSALAAAACLPMVIRSRQLTPQPVSVGDPSR
ncbi:MAG: MFS transporter [Propionicimonas sp.]|uniref:MFS transporter n=1 Tax=Propionicimonas sp. TaxID=1955623 RepID=UPI002B1FA11D|nr:MFS transporter [Propionicimonas sp.]MEA4945306.1 MFS transporter [Propionicimonas sp.]MEA5052935.1 MFS transporter [Propionicimonas sp.]MEA5116144.1 MFS transporter [Propionicimonas sp.]